MLITLGISVVNLRKYNTRLGEDEKIEQEVDTKEPELEVTEYKKDYSYVKDVYTREKLSQIIVDTCARWELNNREVLDEEEEDIFGTGDTTLIDIFELNIPTYKDYEYYVDDNKVNSVVNMVKNMSVKFDGMYDNADNVKLYVNGRFKWEENIKRWSGCIINNDEYYTWSMEIDKSDSVFIRYIGEVSSFSRPFNKKKIYVYV